MATSLLDKTEENQLVSFMLGDEEYGVDIVKVQEIIKVPEITRVPKAPSYVEGVVNLRGNVLPIINTRKRFGMESIEKKGATRIIVADINSMVVGMVVDSVSEVLRIDATDVEPPPNIIANSRADYLKGIGKLDNGKRLISLLELEKVLEAEKEKQEVSRLARRGSVTGNAGTSGIKMEDEAQLVSFKLCGEEYSVDIDLVEEIIRIPEITVIPDVPDYIKGVISLRGKVIPVISLRQRFNMEEKAYDDRSRILVVQARSGDEKEKKGSNVTTFGIIVDVVNEVLSIPLRLIEPPSSLILGETSNHLKGIGKLDDGKRLLLLLNTGEIFETFDTEAIANLSKEEAEELAESKLEGDNKMLDEKQMVIFQIGDEEFGIDIMNVQEIIRMTAITDIPGTADFVEGVVNLRGGVLPVIDLRKRFNLEDKDKTDSNRIVVANHNGSATGIIVDSVSEVLQLPGRDVEPPPPVVSGIEASYIEGIGKMNNGERFIIILELGQILNMSGNIEREHFETTEEDENATSSTPQIEEKPKKKSSSRKKTGTPRANSGKKAK